MDSVLFVSSILFYSCLQERSVLQSVLWRVLDDVEMTVGFPITVLKRWLTKISPLTPALYFQAPKTAPLSVIIAEHLMLPSSKAEELIAIGATYYQPTAELTNEQFDKETLHLRRVMNDFVVSEGDAIRAYPAPRRHSTVIDDVVLTPSAFAWEDYILRESEHYVIVNKPAGLPCHASAENMVDNVLWRLKEHLDRRETTGSTTATEAASPMLPSEPAPLPNVGLYLSQRLDTDTSGLLLVAKSEAWISRLGKYLQVKKYRKWYKLLLCYTASPAAIEGVMNGSLPPLLGVFSPGDVLTSYVVRSDKTPKIYQWDTAGYGPEDMQDAVMKVEAIEEPIVKTASDWVAWQQSLSNQSTPTADSMSSIQRRYTAAALIEWLNNANHAATATDGSAAHRNELIVLQEITVELLTGRTHQIRGQFQALQRHPLIQASPFQQCKVHVAGDHMYPGASFPSELHHQPDSNWSSPFLALASFRFKLDIPPPPARASGSAPAESTHPNTPPFLKASTSKRAAKRQALKNVYIDPLDVSLPSCWWAPLSSLPDGL